MINNDLFLANIVYSVANYGNLSNDNQDFEKNINCIRDMLEILGLLISVHKKRYVTCFNDQMRNDEINLFTNNYKTIFSKIGFIDVQFASDLFLFSLIDNWKTESFKLICSNIMEKTRQCEIIELKLLIYTRLLHCILHASLYGDVFFNDILGEILDFEKRNPDNKILISNIAFLE